jgi:hypothetical protein
MAMLMKLARSKTKQRGAQRRRLAIAIAALASVLGLGLGSGSLHHRDEAPDAPHVAMALGGGAGGGAGSGGTGAGTTQAKAAAPKGPQGEDSPASSRPDDETGLMLLADYVASRADGSRKGDVPDAGDGLVDDEAVLPGAATFQLAQGGFGFGGGGGGGGPGGGGTGGPTGGGGEPGGTVSKPSPGETPPSQIVTTPGAEDGGGDPTCALSNTCDLPGPKTFTPTDDFVGGGDPDGDLPLGGTQAIGESGPIPEPATWLMMIVGFMGLGAALRAQRPKAALG